MTSSTGLSPFRLHGTPATFSFPGADRGAVPGILLQAGPAETTGKGDQGHVTKSLLQNEETGMCLLGASQILLLLCAKLHLGSHPPLGSDQEW